MSAILSRIALGRAVQRTRAPVRGGVHTTGKRSALARRRGTRGRRHSSGADLMGLPDDYFGVEGGIGPVPMGGDCAPACGVRPEQRPNRPRRQPLNFFQAAVAAGATANISQFPQAYFVSQRLSVPSPVSVSFNLNDISIANVSQFVAAGAGSTIPFSEVAQDSILCLDAAYPGVQIVMSVVNTSLIAADFSATLIGCAIR